MLALIAALLLTEAPQAEATILAACAGQGGTEIECSCGLDIARDTLTEREMALFAELTPYLDRDDFGAAFSEALSHADSIGYSPGEVMTAIAKVYEHAEEVEKTCTSGEPKG